MIALLTLVTQLFSFSASAGPDDLAYFKQFLFAKENSSSDPDFPQYQYRYLMANPTFVNSKQQKVMAGITLILYPDGTAEYTYRELIETTPPMARPNGCKTFQSKWSVPDTSLVLEKIGTGARGYLADQYPPQTVKVTFDQNFISDGLKGMSVDFTYGTANTEHGNQFCF
jgi:hypothetical protein